MIVLIMAMTVTANAEEMELIAEVQPVPAEVPGDGGHTPPSGNMILVEDVMQMPVTVEQNVAVNHAGAIITAKPLDLGEEGCLYLTEEEGLNFVGGEISMQRFFNEQQKDRNTEEVEAESISFAVCAYYGIATGENSFGYIATWSKDKELKELRASLETINKTSSELITDIDRNYAELMKEREAEMVVEPEKPLSEMNILEMVDHFMEQGMTEEQANDLAHSEWQARKLNDEPVQAPDNGTIPDPSMSVEAMNAYGYTDENMLPLSKERALELTASGELQTRHPLWWSGL